MVLVAQPVDPCAAVDDDFDVFTGDPVLDSCRQRLGLELIDQYGARRLSTVAGAVYLTLVE